MVTINPYLNFEGNTEEAFNFYKSVFGGEFIMIQRYKETPGGDQMSPEDGEKLMHVALPIGKGNVLMGTDAMEGMGEKYKKGNDVSLSIMVESREEADKIFNDLSAGGQVTMPLGDVFWGDYFGMLIDKFGMQWMVSFPKAKN